MLLGGELVLDEVLQGSRLGGSLVEASLDFLEEAERKKDTISIWSFGDGTHEVGKGIP